MAPKSESSKNQTNVAPRGARSTENLKPLTPVQPEIDDGIEGDDEGLKPSQRTRSRRSSTHTARARTNSSVSRPDTSGHAISDKQSTSTVVNKAASSNVSCRGGYGGSFSGVENAQDYLYRANRRQDGYTHTANPPDDHTCYDPFSMSESDHYDVSTWAKIPKQTAPLPGNMRPIPMRKTPAPRGEEPEQASEMSFSSGDDWSDARKA